MGYRVRQEDGVNKVFEVTNGETKEIERGLGQEESRELARRLNFGGGFDGKTPDFFLNKLTVSV